MEISELQYLISRDDQKAFGQFYQLYYERVFRYTFYFLKNKDACGEVLTNVFFPYGNPEISLRMLLMLMPTYI